jgi:hypothetical protein
MGMVNGCGGGDNGVMTMMVWVWWTDLVYCVMK